MADSPALFRERVQVDRTVPSGYMKHFVSVPENVAKALGLSGPVRVRGEVEGASFSRVLHWSGEGRPYLRFGEGWLRDAGVQPGDRVTVVLERDPSPDSVEIPAELADALSARPEAEEAWAEFTPGKRRTLAYGVERAKRQATRERRAEKVVDEILLDLGLDPDPT